MALRTGVRLVLVLASFVAVALPRPARACSVPPPTDFDKNGTKDIKLVGDGSKQNAIIEMRDTGGYLVKIDCNGNGSYTDGTDVSRSGPDQIESYIVALGGADTVTVLQTEDLIGVRKDIVVPFGGGTNRFTYRAQGFGIRNQSSLAFEVRGAGGGDNVTFDFSGGTINDSLIYVRGDLGEGVNIGSFVGAAQTTDAVVDVSIVLGGLLGNTTGAYNDGGGVVSNSTVSVHFLGNDGLKIFDNVSATFSGQLEDKSRFFLNATLQGGDDRFFGHYDVSTFGVDTTGPPGSEMYLKVNAGMGFDVLKVDDLTAIGSATVDGLVSMDLFGGHNPDAIGLVWHGLTGNGQFRYRADGGVTNDKINGTVVVDPNSNNSLWFQFAGHTENDISALVADIINVTLDAPASVDYGPLGGVMLDGGLQGDDVCNFTGTATRAVIGCEKGVW